MRCGQGEGCQEYQTQHSASETSLRPDEGGSRCASPSCPWLTAAKRARLRSRYARADETPAVSMQDQPGKLPSGILWRKRTGTKEGVDRSSGLDMNLGDFGTVEEIPRIVCR